MYKEFSTETFQKYDEKARETAKSFWRFHGYTCTDHPDQYDVDLVVENGTRRFYCEVEVKTVWHGLEFLFETLHIPVRKAKFLNKPTQFMVFNNSMTRAGIVGRKHVLESPTKEVPNAKISVGERFFDVPKHKAIFVTTY